MWNIIIWSFQAALLSQRVQESCLPTTCSGWIRGTRCPSVHHPQVSVCPPYSPSQGCPCPTATRRWWMKPGCCGAFWGSACSPVLPGSLQGLCVMRTPTPWGWGDQGRKHTSAVLVVLHCVHDSTNTSLPPVLLWASPTASQLSFPRAQ